MGGGSLLLLIPLLCWLLSGSSPPYDCEAGLGNIEISWSQAQKDYCCATVGRGCATTALPGTTPTVPPTPFPTPPPTPPPTEPPRPADPYNCQDGFANWQAGWSVAKKE